MAVGVSRARNSIMSRAQRRGPAFAQVVEIRIPGIYPIPEFGIAQIWAHHDDVDRHTHSQIRPYRRVHRKQSDLESIINIDVIRDRAIQNWFTVFMLADLEIGRVSGAFDEIASGVDHEQP